MHPESTPSSKIECVCEECGTTFRRFPSQQGRYCSRACANAGQRGRSTGRALSIAERFWSKVDTTGECWLWTGKPDPSGYGRLYVDGLARLAHRIAWELMHGPIPEGMDVLHDCPGGDNPLCMRHLWLGTRVENNWDRHSKGRDGSAPGARNGSARLTEEDVRAIRARYAAGGVSYRQLAREYGVAQSQIGFVVRRVHWNHLE